LPQSRPPRKKALQVPEAPVFCSREEHLAAGKALREAVPRRSHADWPSASARRDPIALLEQSNRDRLPELVPIRYGRMLRSPFTFLRGSAGLMAHDLALTPTTGIRVQACGDCHLLNFGLFASAERILLFDINDFDETLPAPWEWDLKRLAVSLVVAGQDFGFNAEAVTTAAVACVRAYREQLRRYSSMSPLEVWYSRLDMDTLIALAPDAKARKRRESYAARARQRVGDRLFPRITKSVGGRPRLLDQPPFLFHPPDEAAFREKAMQALAAYRASLPDERRVLLDRYRIEDVALKVVGIGSVGTRCYVALFFSEQNQPLLLQVKEACPSVLAPYAGGSAYENQGQRVVVGQRLMQSSSDIFLGWAKGPQGHDFYARQMRDMKFSLPLEESCPVKLQRYGEVCAWALARAHAKSGNATLISGYLGKSTVFDEAIGEFALAYAEQNRHDHAELARAEREGRIQTLREDNL